MATNIMAVRRFILDRYVNEYGAKDFRWFEERREKWLKESQEANIKQVDGYETASIARLVAAIIGGFVLLLAGAAGTATHLLPMVAYAAALICMLLCTLRISRLRSSERRRIAAIPAPRREWHERLVALMARVEAFNSRLHAFQLYAANAESGQEVDPAVVEKYAAERQELVNLECKLMRDHATMEFDAANAEDGGSFRETRDLSDAIFMNKVRYAAEDGQPAGSVTELPPDERFRAFDEAADRESASTKNHAG